MEKKKVYGVSQECETHVWRKPLIPIPIIFLSSFAAFFLLGCGILASIKGICFFGEIPSDKK